VTSAAASNSPQSVTVTLTVTASSGGGPVIALSSTTQTFAAPQGGADPAAQTVNVTNGGDGTLDGLTANVTYTAGQPTGWLSAALSAPAAPSTLTLTATTGSLTAGTYSASVAIASAAAGNSPQAVTVTFTVAAPGSAPLIALATTTITFTGTQGSSNPADQTIDVTNGGTGSLTGLAAAVTYASGQPTDWLTAKLSKTRAPSTLTLTANTGTLAPGSYSATVNVTSGVASNSPQTVAVTFTVAAPPPTLVLSTSTLTFTGNEAATSDPAPQTIDITSGTAGTLNDLSASVVYNEGQGWLETSLSATSLPSTLTVTPHLTGLTKGTYTANVTLASPTASNTPQTVAVTFFVDPPTDWLLYGVNPKTDALSIYDARDGTGRVVGPLDPNGDSFDTPVAMALRPTDQALFVWNNALNASLLTVDRVTGQAAALSSQQGTLLSMAFDPAGPLYGVTSTLYSIDPTTGGKASIGPLGSDFHEVGGADFGCDGVLYGVESVGHGPERLLSINTATGAGTAIATLSQDIGVIGSISFLPSGTLVGSASGSASGDILFDLALDGTVSNIRPISAAAGGAPDGMASLRVCTF
jgi:hypothetical protein